MADTDMQIAEITPDEQAVTEVPDASTPFDYPDADVILRSSDSVDFRVHKVLLSLASTIFSDMFALPQAPEGAAQNQTNGGLPVIEVAEGSKVLKRFLFICYPTAAVDRPVFSNEFEVVEELLEVAIKYNAERIEKRLMRMLVSPEFLKADPLRVFAVACRHRKSEEAQLAAKASLAKEILKRPYGPELESITGGQMFQILQYHDECVTAARELAEDPKNVPGTGYRQAHCHDCSETTTFRWDGLGTFGLGMPDTIRKALAARVPERIEVEAAMEGLLIAPGRRSFACEECGDALLLVENTIDIDVSLSVLTQGICLLLENAVLSVSSVCNRMARI